MKILLESAFIFIPATCFWMALFLYAWRTPQRRKTYEKIANINAGLERMIEGLKKSNERIRNSLTK